MRRLGSAAIYAIYTVTLLGVVSAVYVARPLWHAWAVRNVQATAFDSTAWATAPLDDTRLAMVDDLLDKYRLRGMHERDIIALLGEERDTRKAERNLTYLLSPGFMDPVVLVVVIDSLGRAVKVTVEST